MTDRVQHCVNVKTVDLDLSCRSFVLPAASVAIKSLSLIIYDCYGNGCTGTESSLSLLSIRSIRSLDYKMQVELLAAFNVLCNIY